MPGPARPPSWSDASAGWSSELPSGRSAPSSTSIAGRDAPSDRSPRSEKHTSELQSPSNLVCRLLLAKKKRAAAHHRGRLPRHRRSRRALAADEGQAVPTHTAVARETGGGRRPAARGDARVGGRAYSL